MNLHHFLTTKFSDVLNVNANQMNLLLNNTQKCLNHVFLQEQRKNYLCEKNLTQKQLHGPMIWKDTPQNMWKGTTNLRTRKLSNNTKFQVLAWMITNSRKRNLIQLENYMKYAHELFSNACIWQELEDLTSLDSQQTGSGSHEVDSSM